MYNSPSAGSLPLWVGQDAGIFAQNGLDVDLQIVSNDTQSVAALLSGQAEFIQASGAAALSPAADGADIVVLAVITPVYDVLLESSPNVKTADDLKGKTMTVSAIGGSGYLATVAALRHLGLDPAKDVTILTTGSGPARTAALQSDQVQAATVPFLDGLRLERQGFTRLLDLASLHLPAAGQATIADKSWIASHGDLTQRYVDAFMQANLRAKSDKATAVAAMREHLPGETDEQLSLAYDYYVQEVFPDVPRPDPALFADAVQQLGQTDEKVADLDLTTLMDPSFVNNAVAATNR